MARIEPPLRDYPWNVYVAAPMSDQVTAMRLTLALIDAGFHVTSSWIRHDFADKPAPIAIKAFAEYEAKWGETDMADVANADTLVIVSNVESTSGGMHFELGYFQGLGKTNVIVWGPERPNVFFYTSNIRRVNTDLQNLVRMLVAEKDRHLVGLQPKRLPVEVEPSEVNDVLTPIQGGPDADFGF